MLQTYHSKLTVKKLTEDGTFEGYGAVFGNVDSTYDVIQPGAFRDTLAEKKLTDIKMLWQHDPSMPIGVWQEMSEDDTGLKVKGKILTTVQKGAEALALMQAGVLDGLSIGFRTVKSMWEEGTDYRQLLAVDLWEVSVVTFPANPKAKVDRVKSLRDMETILRDAGLSNNFAKLVAKHGYEEASRLVAKDHREGGLEAVTVNVADIFGI